MGRLTIMGILLAAFIGCESPEADEPAVPPPDTPATTPSTPSTPPETSDDVGAADDLPAGVKEVPATELPGKE